MQMNNIEVDFTIPETSTEVDMSFPEDFNVNIFAIKGDKGEDGINGQDGQDGTDGRGITSITKTSTSGLVDTYTITYTDNTTSTFEVTNGQDGEVTEEYVTNAINNAIGSINNVLATLTTLEE